MTDSSKPLPPLPPPTFHASFATAGPSRLHPTPSGLPSPRHSSVDSSPNPESVQGEDFTATIIHDQLPPVNTSSAVLPSSKPRLSKRIAIPRTGPNANAPFLRAHPARNESGIDQLEWIKFVDGLNMACKMSAALKIVGLVGASLEMVPNIIQDQLPNPYLSWASTGTVVAASVGNHLYAKRTCDKYLQAANDRLFHPKGLTCRIFSTEALQVLLSRRANKSGNSKVAGIFKKVGPLAMGLGMPIVDRAVHLAANFADAKPTDMIERYRGRTTESADHALGLMDDAIARLEISTFPPPVAPRGWTDQASKWVDKRKGVPSQDKKAEKEENKLEAKVLKEQKRRNEGKKPKTLGYREQNLVLKSHWDMESTVWVVVMNEEEDEKIIGARQYDEQDTIRISEKEIADEAEREQAHNQVTSYTSGSTSTSSAAAISTETRSSVSPTTLTETNSLSKDWWKTKGRKSG